MNIEVKKLSDSAIVPTKAHDTDAGIDLYCSETVTINRYDRKLVKTDIAVKIPEGYYGQIFDRSSIAWKRGMHTMAGVIDSSYRGEIKILLFNSERPQVIEKGDKIAQLVLLQTPKVDITEVETLDDTERGDGGFGSSGK